MCDRGRLCVIRVRAALSCAGEAGSDRSCFAPGSIDYLAGHGREFGAMGAPDSDELSDPAAHCDNADFLDGRSPRAHGQATASLVAHGPALATASRGRSNTCWPAERGTLCRSSVLGPRPALSGLPAGVQMGSEPAVFAARVLVKRLDEAVIPGVLIVLSCASTSVLLTVFAVALAQQPKVRRTLLKEIADYQANAEARALAAEQPAAQTALTARANSPPQASPQAPRRDGPNTPSPEP